MGLLLTNAFCVTREPGAQKAPLNYACHEPVSFLLMHQDRKNTERKNLYQMIGLSSRFSPTTICSFCMCAAFPSSSIEVEPAEHIEKVA